MKPRVTIDLIMLPIETLDLPETKKNLMSRNGNSFWSRIPIRINLCRINKSLYRQLEGLVALAL